MKLDYQSIDEGVFCDYLRVTFPLSIKESISVELLSLFEILGISPSDNQPGSYEVDSLPGRIFLKDYKHLLLLSISGSICRHIRTHNSWDSLISILCVYDHRVTRLDATADFRIANVPDHIQALKNASQASKIRLTRKELPSSRCKALLSIDQFGRETGTIYLGDRRTQDVTATIYDKRHERVSKGYADCGEMIRVEISLGEGSGISLRDVHNPEQVFYHYAHTSLVIPPPHITAWTPHGSGFTIERQQDLFTPAGKILNMLKFSPLFGRITSIALREWGDDALSNILDLVRVAFKVKSKTNL